MARPPRGRLPDLDRSNSELRADELPLDLPRVEPERSRAARTIERLLSKDTVSDGQPLQVDRPASRLHPAPRATGSYIPDPKPIVNWPERLADPFNYHAVPSKPVPAEKPVPVPSVAARRDNDRVRSEEPNYITKKYYEPRSDFIAPKVSLTSDDPVDAWPSFVKSTRPVVDFDYGEGVSQPQSRPVIREYGARPFVKTHDDRASSGNRFNEPSSLKPTADFSELHVPSLAPVQARVATPDRTADIDPAPKFPNTFDDPFRTIDFSSNGPLTDQTDHPLHTPALDADDRDPEFDPRVRPAFSQQFVSLDESVPISAAPIETSSSDYVFASGIPSSVQPVPSQTERQIPDWMRRSQYAAPMPTATYEWGQEDAMYAMAERVRDRGHVAQQEPRQNFVDSMLQQMRQVFGRWRIAAQSRVAQRQAHDIDPDFGIGPDLDDALNHDVNAVSKHALDADISAEKQTFGHVRPRGDVDHELRVGTSGYVGAELRATRAINTAPSSDVLSTDQRIAQGISKNLPQHENRFWLFFKRRRRASTMLLSEQSGRVLRRKKQARLYEDIVAWIVVPPFIIGMIYGGLELAKFLSNSPLGKLLLGQ